MQTTFWTKVSIHLVNYSQHCFYLCCVKCKKSIGSSPGDTSTCNYYELQKAVAVPRCLIEFELQDETSKILARAYGEVAEKIVNCSAQEIMEAIKNGGQQNVMEIVDMKLDPMVLVKIKTSQNHFEQNELKCYSIY